MWHGDARNGARRDRRQQDALVTGAKRKRASWLRRRENTNKNNNSGKRTQRIIARAKAGWKFKKLNNDYSKLLATVQFGWRLFSMCLAEGLYVFITVRKVLAIRSQWKFQHFKLKRPNLMDLTYYFWQWLITIWLLLKLPLQSIKL